MIQGLFLDGVDGKGTWSTIRKRIQLAVPALSASAESPAAFLDMAVMRTELALHSVLGSRIEAGFLHYSSDSFTTSV